MHSGNRIMRGTKEEVYLYAKEDGESANKEKMTEGREKKMV